MQFAVTTVKEEMSQSPHRAGNMTVVGRRNNRVDPVSGFGMAQEEVGTDASRALGAVGQALVRTENRTVGNILVLRGRQ